MRRKYVIMPGPGLSAAPVWLRCRSGVRPPRSPALRDCQRLVRTFASGRRGQTSDQKSRPSIAPETPSWAGISHPSSRRTYSNTASSAQMTADGETTASPPSRFGLLLYPGFQALDAFGGIDALNILSKRQKLTLSVLAADRAPVSTSMAAGGFGQAVVPTHTLQDAPADLEVLLIPGGIGTRQADNIAREIEFVRAAFPNLRHLLTVCTGTVLAAKAGVLEGHRATTNKLEFNWVCGTAVSSRDRSPPS